MATSKLKVVVAGLLIVALFVLVSFVTVRWATRPAKSPSLPTPVVAEPGAAAATERADGDLSAYFADFKSKYSLGPQRAVVRVWPIPDSRNIYYSSVFFGTIFQTDHPPPTSILYRYHGDTPTLEGFGGDVVWHGSSESMAPTGQDVTSILAYAHDLIRLDMEGDPQLTNAIIPGDFIFRAGASAEQLNTELASIFSKEMGRTLSLEFRQVPRPIYVFRGRWQYHPLDPPTEGTPPQIYLYSSVPFGPSLPGGALSSARVGRGGPVIAAEYFGRQISSFLDAPVVFESDNLPPAIRIMRSQDEQLDREQILTHIAEQTGLALSQETRNVRRLFIESSAKVP